MLAAPGSGISTDEAPLIAHQLVSNAIFRSLDDVVISRPSFLKELRVTEVSGINHLDSALATGNGVLIVTGHYSAARLARRYLAAIGHPILPVRTYQASAESAGRLSGRRFGRPRRCGSGRTRRRNNSGASGAARRTTTYAQGCDRTLPAAAGRIQAAACHRVRGFHRHHYRQNAAQRNCFSE